MRLARSIFGKFGLVVLRRRDGTQVLEGNSVRPAVGFQKIYTTAAVDDLYDPAFDAALRHAAKVTNYSDIEKLRARVYFATKFAEATLAHPGDLLFAGVNRGVTPHCILAYLGNRIGTKRLVLVDPWTGAHNRSGKRENRNYTDDFEEVRSTFSDAPIDFVRDYIPDALSAISGRGFSFVLLNTGDPQSEIASIESLFGQLCPSGVMMIAGYGGKKSIRGYRAAVEGLPGTTINLLNGNALVIRQA